MFPPVPSTNVPPGLMSPLLHRIATHVHREKSGTMSHPQVSWRRSPRKQVGMTDLSASLTKATAARSLTEPLGLRCSALARIRHPVSRERLLSSAGASKGDETRSAVWESERRGIILTADHGWCLAWALGRHVKCSGKVGNLQGGDLERRFEGGLPMRGVEPTVPMYPSLMSSTPVPFPLPPTWRATTSRAQKMDRKQVRLSASKASGVRPSGPETCKVSIARCFLRLVKQVTKAEVPPPCLLAAPGSMMTAYRS